MAAKLTIDVLSLFPDMVEAPLGGSILGKARDRSEEHTSELQSH